MPITFYSWIALVVHAVIFLKVLENNSALGIIVDLAISIAAALLSMVIVDVIILLMLKPGQRSSGVKGDELFSVPALFDGTSIGDLVVTTEVIAFVPAAWRITGKAEQGEAEVIIPLRELDGMSKKIAFGIFPLGLRIMRKIGDEERFAVGRPDFVIQAIEDAKQAWQADQHRASPDL